MSRHDIASHARLLHPTKPTMTQDPSTAVPIAAPGRPLSARGVAAMLLLALIWGLSIPLTKLGLETVPPITLTALRFLVAVPVFLVLATGRLAIPWRAAPSMAALGVTGITLGNVAQSFGVEGTSASAGTIISATIPIFIVLFAAIRLKQAVAGRQWLGLVVAFAGIALVALGGEAKLEGTAETTLGGVAWMLVSAIAIAFYYIWSAELAERYGMLAVAAWNGVAGLIGILPLAGWELMHEPVDVTIEAAAIIVYLGVLVTVAGLLLWLHLLQIVPARVAAGVQYLQPVFGILAAAAIFGDRLGLMFAAGVVLILAGLALAVAEKRPSPPRAIAAQRRAAHGPPVSSR